MIKVSGLTKAYGKKIAVKDLSFTIGQGERVGFLGPNGAGKTTTMNMLTGYLASSYGKIEIGGFDLLENPAKAKQCIGYLPEIPPLYTDMTVWEYLCFAFDLKKCRFNKKAHLEEICQVVKLEEVRGRLIRNLSKGYKQRVGLAQALIGDPPILILDEPTVGLDPKEIVEIRNLIRRLGSTRTVILSSHILSEVQAVCQRVMILKDGELILDASAEELTVVPGANSRYGVRLTAPENEVIPVLSQLSGVARVEYVGSYESGTVDIILEAETVYIIGIRTCEPLADFLSFYLNMIRGNVRLVRTTSVSEIFEQMLRIDERDVVIGISFPRYSMRTLKALEFANDRNARVIAITDSVHSPMNLYSSCNLLARSDMVSIVDSLVAPLSVINALVVALCMKRPEEVRQELEMLEDTWNNYQIYMNDEINFIGEEPL